MACIKFIAAINDTRRCCKSRAHFSAWTEMGREPTEKFLSARIQERALNMNNRVVKFDSWNAPFCLHLNEFLMYEKHNIIFFSCSMLFVRTQETMKWQYKITIRNETRSISSEATNKWQFFASALSFVWSQQ